MLHSENDILKGELEIKSADLQGVLIQLSENAIEKEGLLQ